MTEPLKQPLPAAENDPMMRRIEILAGCPDEAEMAAIVATVLSLQAEAAASAAQASQAPAGLSPWRSAGLYESVSRDPLEQHSVGLRTAKGIASLWPG